MRFSGSRKTYRKLRKKIKTMERRPDFTAASYRRVKYFRNICRWVLHYDKLKDEYRARLPASDTEAK